MKTKTRITFLSGIFSILYAVALMFSVPAQAASVTSHELYGLHDTAYAGGQTEQVSGLDSLSSEVSNGTYFSNFGAGSFNYYTQLNPMQKAVFDTLKNLKPNSKTVDIRFQYTGGYPTDASLIRIMQGGLDALICDCPELFWLDVGKCRMETSYENKRNPEITITFEPAVKSKLVNQTETMVQKFQSATNSISAAGSNRYQKLKSIHDSLAGRVQYDYDALEYYEQYGTVSDDAELSFDAYGALVNGVAVCQGYAMAFKLICDREKIPCIVVAGYGYTSPSDQPIGHMWNAVQMEDGKWYNVDVTWDDQSTIFYDFFLAGSDSSAPAFTTLTFSESHRANGDFSGQGYMEFSYPSFSKSRYGTSQPSETTSPTSASSSTTTTTVKRPTIPKQAPSIKPVNVISETTAPQKKTEKTTTSPTSTSTESAEQTTADASTADFTAETQTVDSIGEQSNEIEEIEKKVNSQNGWNSGTTVILLGIIFIVTSAGVLVFLIIRHKADKKM